MLRVLSERKGSLNFLNLILKLTFLQMFSDYYLWIYMRTYLYENLYLEFIWESNVYFEHLKTSHFLKKKKKKQDYSALSPSLSVSLNRSRGPQTRTPVPLASPALLEASLQHFSAVGWGEVERSTLNMTLRRALLFSSRSTALLNSLLFVPLFI